MLISTKSRHTGLHVFRSLRHKYSQLSARRQLAHSPSPSHSHSLAQGHSLLLRNDLLVVSDEIRLSSKPVVALESTIITHGLPYPQNLETALQVEEEIRALDVLPATIAFLNGKLRVGLDKAEIEQVARSHEHALKISRRDIAHLLANRDKPHLVGGTTVSGTMIAANAANIPIFCTGGIGGVHRDLANSLDVSADLTELARTPVAVVSSGIKSILDIAKTLEYLETLGVCVYTLAASGSKELPAFFTSRSGCDAAYNCLNELEAAKVIQSNLDSGLNMGMLIGVPIPEECASNADEIEAAISEALSEAARSGIKGKRVTPFLLDRINKLTEGRSLASNIALIRNNARTSAKIALELKKLQSQADGSRVASRVANESARASKRAANECDKKVTLIGGINLDSTYKLTDEETIHMKGVTQPVVASSCMGGVARNMAEALLRLGAHRSTLLSSIAGDVAGKYVLEHSAKIGFDTSKWLHLKDQQMSTGSYNAIFDTKGELLFGCGDMRSHSTIDRAYIEANLDTVADSDMCVLDADIPVETVLFIVNYCWEQRIPIWYNPTDLRKSTKVVDAGVLSKLTFMSPNTKELFAIFNATFERDQRLDESEREAFKILGSKYKDIFTHLQDKDLEQILKYLIQFVPVIILSRGPKDLMVACAYDLDLDQPGQQFPTRATLHQVQRQPNKQPVVVEFPVLQFDDSEKYVNESGAGDSMSSGIIYGILRGFSCTNTIYNGILSAKLALLTSHNVSEDLGNIDSERLDQLTSLNKFKIKKRYL